MSHKSILKYSWIFTWATVLACIPTIPIIVPNYFGHKGCTKRWFECVHFKNIININIEIYWCWCSIYPCWKILKIWYKLFHSDHQMPTRNVLSCTVRIEMFNYYKFPIKIYTLNSVSLSKRLYRSLESCFTSDETFNRFFNIRCSLQH